MKNKTPWLWIPTLYMAEGIPYTIVATAFASIMYKELGLTNAEIAFYTGWLYLPWVIKPFWSPFVDAMKTKRWWILLTQLLIGAGFAGVALSIPTSAWLQVSLALFWLVGFSSATHDISADGFYMLALDSHEQSFFVGIRSTFYRISMIVGQGGLLMLPGLLQSHGCGVPTSWCVTLYAVSGLFLFLFLYHFFALPKPEQSLVPKEGGILLSFFDSFKTFFQKKDILLSLAFVLLYRLGESQLGKMSSLFLTESLHNGGMGLSKEEFGLAYGTIGVLSLTVGGVLGGIYVSKVGLKRAMMPMTVMMNLPNLAYVIMAWMRPMDLFEVTSLIALEQFGYGFGFTAFMLYLIYMSQGEYKTSHYAICTGFMALGMMLPGMAAGKIEEMLGYTNFFVWVCVCTIPAFLISAMLKIDESFGKKNTNSKIEEK